ncbi:MAG: terminase small subunit [Gammaproteobacteria bacterium]
MNPKQAKFVEEYLVDFNAAAAARRSGYSERTARSIGQELLTKPDVQAALADRSKELSDDLDVSPQRVIRELAIIAFQDQDNYSTWGPNGVELRESSELGEALTRAVAEVTETRTKDGGSIKFKLYDKIKALELIGKYHAMFVDKHGLDEDTRRILEHRYGRADH